MGHLLPPKPPNYLLRLHLTYSRIGKTIPSSVIASCKYMVVEETNFDNWNGGTYGHDLKLFLPIDVLSEIDLDDIHSVAEGIREDLNKLASAIDNEFVNAVHLEMDDDADLDCRNATPFSTRPIIKPEAVSFWKSGFARVFVSHRDQHKLVARELSDALSEYGVSSFVAHDTIQPMSEWRAEIMKGLETMEVMLVFLTDDFEESHWTNQEVGYALGKGVPVISLKLGRKDPPAFISHMQALRGRIDNLPAAARGLYPLIADALGRRERLQEVLVRSFLASTSFLDTRDRFDRMRSAVKKLSDDEISQIITGYYLNDQLYGSVYLDSKHARLKTFLEETSGQRFEIAGREIRKLGPPTRRSQFSNDIPF